MRTRPLPGRKKTRRLSSRSRRLIRNTKWRKKKKIKKYFRRSRHRQRKQNETGSFGELN